MHSMQPAKATDKGTENQRVLIVRPNCNHREIYFSKGNLWLVNLIFCKCVVLLVKILLCILLPHVLKPLSLKN